MQDERELYARLRKKFQHKDGFDDVLRIGDYEILRFDWESVVKEGGKAQKNLACFHGDKLLWVAAFPSYPDRPDFNLVTGIGPSPRGADKVLVSTWSGNKYDVDIATGEYEYVGWTK